MPAPIQADLTGKTCVVTGANTGIGKECARQLAALGARVVMGCRSAERGEAALKELQADGPKGSLELRIVDLADPASIAAFAEGLAGDLERLDALVNNAGLWMTERTLTGEGYETTFAVNVLGPFRLTNALEPLLKASGAGRVVDVASKMANGLDLDDLMFERRSFSGTAAYAQSKQANRMLAWVRAERLGEEKVTVNALHPGVVSTEIARSASGLFGLAARGYFKIAGRTAAQGADTAVWLAASPDVEGVSGKWWGDRKERRCKYRVRNQNLALWAKCEALAG